MNSIVVPGHYTPPDRLEGIRLIWEPTYKPAHINVTELAGTANVKVQVAPFTDTRVDWKVLGQSHPEGTRQVTTRNDVAAFVTDKVRVLISEVGFDVVASGGTVILKADIRSFSVDEGESYQGDVRLAVSVISPSAKVLWRGIASGSVTRTGRPYKASNYYETLSDSLTDAVDNLMKSPGFLEALTRHS